MATLSGNKIKNTYQSLVKFSDNGNITTSAKQLTDGFGNNSPMFVSTTQVGIGVTPESGLNLHVFGDAKIGSNLTVIGNLVVEGSTTTVGTDTLTVKDPLIVLANNNTSTDAVDIGFYGKYTPSGTTLYSGLFREALTGKYRLFKGLQDEPTTTVNTSGTGYTKADLVIGDLEAERGTFTDSIFVSPSLYVSDAILHTGDIDTKLEFLSDQIKFSTGGSFRLSINNSYSEFFTNVRFEDGIKAQFGDNQDLKIYYDGTTDRAYFNSTSANQSIFAGGAESFIRVGGTQNALVANHNGNVSLNYSGATKLSTSSTGVTVEGIVASDGLDLGDNDKIRLGDSQDLEIYHNGTHSYIDNNTGDIIIRNDAADKGISFLADDGAGGSENYVYIDGGTFQTKFYKDTKHLDSVKAFFGTGNDLEIYHNGSHAYLTNDTGNFEITTTNNLILQDASSNKWMMTNQGGGVLLYYNGGTSKLTTTPTGISINGRISGLTDPTLAQDAATKAYVDTIFASSDTLAEVLSFGNETLGNSIIITTEDDVFFRDNSMAIFGNANDLSIYHDSSNSHIRNATGDLLISALEADSNIKFYTDNGTGTTVSNLEISGSTGTVSLKYYGSQKLYTTSTGVSITGRISQLTDPSAAQDAATKSYVDSQVGANNELSEVLANGNTTGSNDIEVTNGNINFEDSTNASKGRAYFGNQSDLAIYHDSTNSYIAEGGVGSLNLLTNTLNIQTFVDTVPTPRETMATFVRDGAVSLYYDNSKKFETTSTGVSVTGGGAFTDNISIVGNVKKLQWIDTQGNWKIESGNGSNKLVIHSESLVEDYLTIKGTGVIQLNDYGSGSNTGTATQKLAVDSSGNIIEIPIGGGAVDGSGTANTVTMWSDADTITDAPITISGNNATLSGIFNIGTHNAYAIKLQRGDGTYVPFAATASDYLYLYNSNASGNIRIRNAADTVSLIEITDSGNSTFAGDVIINGNGKVLDLASDNYLRLGDNQDLQIVHTYSGGDSIIDSFSGEFKIRQRAENINLTFGTYSGDAMVIDTSGNVGIGTTTPDTNLEVESSTGGVLRLTSSNTTVLTGESIGKIEFKSNDASTGGNNVMGFIDSVATNVGTRYALSFGTGDAAAAVERMRIDNLGNVGIGTTSPQQKLQVSGGNVIINGGSSNNLYLSLTSNYLYGDVNGVVIAGANNNFRIKTDGSERVRVIANGKVGIGTASPEAMLDIHHTDTMIRLTDSDGTNQYAQFGHNNGDTTFVSRNNTSHGTYSFYTHDGTTFVERMSIQSDGNVGIGTTTPQTKLDINSGTANSALRVLSTDRYTGIKFEDATNNDTLFYDGQSDLMYLSSTNFRAVDIYATGNVGIGTDSPAYNLQLASASSTTISVIADAATSASVYFGDSASATQGRISYNNANDSFLFFTNALERMRIASSGNVGIGTTNPEGILQIARPSNAVYDGTNDSGQSNIGASVTITNTNTTVNSFAQINMQVSASSNRAVGRIVTIARGSASSDMAFVTESFGVRAEKMRIDQTGNVGIGTTSPDEKLVVNGNILISDTSNDKYFGSNVNLILNADADGNSGSSARNIIFQNRGSEKMRIDSEGSVGIGTTSPEASLHVTTDSAAGTFRLSPQDGTYEDYRLDIRAQASDAGALTMKLKDNTFLKTYGYYNLTGVSHGVAGYEDLLHLKNNGNVGIGTTSPVTKLHLYDNTATVGLSIQADNASSSDINLGDEDDINIGRIKYDHSTDSMQFQTNNAERMRITSGGNIDISNSTTGNAGTRIWGDSDGGIIYMYRPANGGTNVLRFYVGTTLVGNISTTNTATTYNSASDYRLKEDLQDFAGLDMVSKIPVYDFKWKADDNRSYGVMAHELKEVLPQAVNGEKDAEEMQSVDYSKIVPLLVKSIQELKAEIETLKTQINN